MERKRIREADITSAFSVVKEHMKEVLKKHGDGIFSTTHEMLGTITEEYHELIEAVRSNKPLKVMRELSDLGVLAVFSLACFYRSGIPSDRG